MSDDFVDRLVANQAEYQQRIESSPEVPVQCPSCGKSFPVKGAEHMAAFVKIVGATATTVLCPHCGSNFILKDDLEGRLPPGPIQLLSIKDWLPYIDELKRIAAAASEPDASFPEILLELHGVNPELAEKVRKKGIASVLVLLLFLQLLISAIEKGVEISFEHLANMATEIHQTDPGATSLPPGSLPSPPSTLEPSPTDIPPVVLASGASMSRQVRRQLEREARKKGPERA